jgi:hypothetical protein
MTEENNTGLEGEEPITPPVEGDEVTPPIETPVEPPVEPVEPDADPGLEPEPVTLTKEEYDRLNKRITDKDTFIRTQQSELDKLKNAPPVEPTPEPAVNTSGKPQLDDFADYEQYNEALMDWKLAEKENLKSVNALAEAEERERQERTKSFDQRANVFRAKHDDFDEVANSPEMRHIYTLYATVSSGHRDRQARSKGPNCT